MTDTDVPLTNAGELDCNYSDDTQDWFWTGYLRPGDITLLTSQWKLGKTTMLAGLLRRFGDGQPFLDKDVKPTKTVVLTEESRSHWSDRKKLIPFDRNVQLMIRPFAGRPTREQWFNLIDQCCRLRQLGNLDLFVIDPLASFLPGRCESDAATLLDALLPLHQLSNLGASVLILHHPKKDAKESGCLARGSGALLGFVDISLELTRYSRWKADGNRRLLSARSRSQVTLERLAFDWNPATGDFTAIPDPALRSFEENWATIAKVFEGRNCGINANEILEFWPEDVARPGLSTLYVWLNLAFEKKLCRREGNGTKKAPWRYRLKNKNDEYYDRGELPPLRGI